MSRQLVPGSSISAGQFLFLPDVQGKRLELNDGQVVEIPGSGARLNEIAFNLAMLLRHHANRNDLGWASGDGAGYVLPGELETVVIPDASFVGKERIPLDGRQEGIRPFPPDLVVEIASPHDRAAQVHDKVWRYLEAGVSLIWVLWPDRRSISVYQPGGRTFEQLEQATLDGGDVLPGFSTKVSGLFDR